MKELKELKEISNDIIKEELELLEELEANMIDYEEMRQEFEELERKHNQMNKFMLSVGSMTALYGLMLVIRIIMIAIQ